MKQSTVVANVLLLTKIGAMAHRERMRNYPVQMEVAGPVAMFTRVDTGGTPTSYPAPTISAVKGMFDAIALLASGTAWIAPVRIEVCRKRGDKGGTVRYESYATNYGGPLRKTSLMENRSSMQLYATVLIDVCYRLHGEVRGPPVAGLNPRHQLQEMFLRRLAKGQCHSTPALGWREFTCSYWGPFREEMEVDDALNLSIPSMLTGMWSAPVNGVYAPGYAQDVQIRSGVLDYAE